jgi:ribosomal protein S12 methylthiotransferase accessory factor
MEMEISFPGGKKVDSDFKGFTVQTDQNEKAGGEGTAPSPTELFLASIGTCAGFFALTFCDKRKLNTDGLKINVDFQANRKTFMIEKIVMHITLPENFPDKYADALIKAIDLCHVKKHFSQPPQFEYQTSQSA